jgi:hypothetical protein
MVEGRICTKCGIWKDADQFHKDIWQKNKTGLRAQCKDSASVRQREFRIANYEKYRAWEKNSSAVEYLRKHGR